MGHSKIDDDRIVCHLGPEGPLGNWTKILQVCMRLGALIIKDWLLQANDYSNWLIGPLDSNAEG